MKKRPSDELIELVANTIAATPAGWLDGEPNRMGSPEWTVKAATRVLLYLRERGVLLEEERPKRRFHWLHDWSRWEQGEGDWVRPNGRRFTTEVQIRQCADCGKEQVRRLA